MTIRDEIEQYVIESLEHYYPENSKVMNEWFRNKMIETSGIHGQWNPETKMLDVYDPDGGIGHWRWNGTKWQLISKTEPQSNDNRG